MKEEIRNIILSCGADLCGFANIDCFDDAPSGYKPTDIYPECKSVISFAVALPKGLAQVDPRFVYGHFNYNSCDETDVIAFNCAKKIEKSLNCIAVPVPCDCPYEYWDAEKMEGRGLLSMKHTAVRAGLGILGKSTLLINDHYGNLLTLGAILVNLDLPSDPLSEIKCIVNCRKCMDACPVNAIENGSVNQKLCRMNTYGKSKRGFDTTDCNKCRTVCPMNHMSIRIVKS